MYTNYFIDTENIGGSFLNDLSLLGKSDCIYIFYSSFSYRLTFDEALMLKDIICKIKTVKIDRVGENYLDFQLSTFIGYLVAKQSKHTFVIISKDKGYNAVVDLWQSLGIKIEATDSIKKHLKKLKHTQKVENKDGQNSPTVKQTETKQAENDIQNTNNKVQPETQQTSVKTTQNTAKNAIHTDVISTISSNPVTRVSFDSVKDMYKNPVNDISVSMCNKAVLAEKRLVVEITGGATGSKTINSIIVTAGAVTTNDCKIIDKINNVAEYRESKYINANTYRGKLNSILSCSLNDNQYARIMNAVNKAYGPYSVYLLLASNIHPDIAAKVAKYYYTIKSFEN